jgi:hypothetical protein
MNYPLSAGLQPQSNKVFDSYVEIENKNRIVDNYSTMAEKKDAFSVTTRLSDAKHICKHYT